MGESPTSPDPRFQPGVPPRPPSSDANPFEFDDGDAGSIRQRRNWLDEQFGGTSVFLLVVFAMCCGVFAFAFSIAGVVGCTDPHARRNAIIVLCICIAMMLLGFAVNVGQAVLEIMKR